jgi:hypothetical protein
MDDRHDDRCPGLRLGPERTEVDRPSDAVLGAEVEPDVAEALARSEVRLEVNDLFPDASPLACTGKRGKDVREMTTHQSSAATTERLERVAHPEDMTIEIGDDDERMQTRKTLEDLMRRDVVNLDLRVVSLGV